MTGAAEATTSATAMISFFMGVSPLSVRLDAGISGWCVGVRKAFGHDWHGGGDDQGNGDNELPYESSPLKVWPVDLWFGFFLMLAVLGWNPETLP